MFLVLRLLYEHVREFDEKYRDRRSENFFLLGKPLQMFIAVGLYYAIIKHVGPRLMKNREPFNLKNILLIYNILQVAANAYLGLAAVYYLIAERPYTDLTCMVPHVDMSRLGLLEMRLGYAYLILKVIDYLDTVFFVLRKSYKQITFLHIYHHIMVSLGTFVYMRYLPGGHGSALGVLNCFVHAIMYFYYFISALRPELKKSLWWKKYITQVQILQFVILIVHFTLPLVRTDCQYSKVAALFALAQNVVMVVLFSDFYYKAYMRQKPKMPVVQNGSTSVPVSKVQQNGK